MNITAIPAFLGRELQNLGAARDGPLFLMSPADGKWGGNRIQRKVSIDDLRPRETHTGECGLSNGLVLSHPGLDNLHPVLCHAAIKRPPASEGAL